MVARAELFIKLLWGFFLRRWEETSAREVSFHRKYVAEAAGEVCVLVIKEGNKH